MSDTEIVVSAPPNSSFTLVDVSVENANGEAALPRAYAYLDPGLIIADQVPFFGGSLTQLFHVDVATHIVTALPRPQVKGAGLNIDSLTYAAGGFFYAGGRDGNLHEISVDGRVRPVGGLMLPRAPNLAVVGGEIFAFLKDRNQGILALGTLAAEDASFNQLAAPTLNDNRVCLASDGDTLWAITRSPETGTFELFEVDPATAEPDDATIVEDPQLSQ
jgi:hypothetical protein